MLHITPEQVTGTVSLVLVELRMFTYQRSKNQPVICSHGTEDLGPHPGPQRQDYNHHRYEQRANDLKFRTSRHWINVIWLRPRRGDTGWGTLLDHDALLD